MGRLDRGLGEYLGALPSLNPHDEGLPTISIRLFAINAPELNDPDPNVRLQAEEARDYLRGLVQPGDLIRVLSMSWDKYSQRIDAIPYSTSGEDLCQAMLASGHAVPYTA